ATQPSLDGRLSSGVREICPDVPGLYDFFRRVTYKVIGEHSDKDIAQMINSCKSALCVVNSRRGARSIYGLIKGEGTYHLSTYMTPSSIAKKLEEIRDRLKENLPCIVVSTSLVEAGVDLDFPYVFREEAGLDSIIQAGGRCNREGKRDVADSVVTVFRRNEKNPRFDAVRAITSRICEDFDDIASPEAIRKYFKELYYINPSDTTDKLDSKAIIPMLEKGSFMYRSVDEKYKLIDKEQRQVLIPNENNAKLCDMIRKNIRNLYIMRQAMRDCVSLYEDEFREIAKTGVLTDCGDIAILEDPECYDENIGLIVKDTGDALFA
ncbi:MAG TPA: CRISPR-associated helicase/endonuclease Cas3, partial [Bacillota bacterium]|nr:CRISPR-associated helicase/endonuclease Cas3 [Bacillota bacterium]